MSDASFVRQAVKGCDIIFHLAALIGIPYSYVAPESYVATNISGTLNLLQAARELSIEKIVHTSTSEVYGTAQFTPITETHPLQGQSPYSATKIAADQLALSFYSSFKLPVAVARPFNTYGPRQSARAVIPTVISQIAAGSTDIQLGAIHPTRDFNYVADIVNGFIAIANSPASIGEVINLGSNFEVSIGQTVELIAKLMGKDVNILTDNKRVRPSQSEVERLWASNEKALHLLDWQPIYSGLDGFQKGLSHTIEWFTQAQNLQGYKSHIYNI